MTKQIAIASSGVDFATYIEDPSSHYFPISQTLLSSPLPILYTPPPLKNPAEEDC